MTENSIAMRKIAVQHDTSVRPLIWIGCFLAAVTVLFLAACSSSNSNAARAAPSANESAYALPEPCSLITQAEVESALGKGATMSAVNNTRIGKQECRMKPAANGKIEEIVMVVQKADLWDATKKAMLPPTGDAKIVPGLGDDAFVGRAIGYNVRKGTRYIQVFGAVTNQDTANDKATRYIAERAWSRL